MITDYEDRHIPFTGCFNFRDIGGYPTADGRQVKWGRYFRTGRQDRMTDADVAQARALGVSSQIDLRKHDEISEQGRGPFGAMGAAYHHIPVIPEGGTERLNQLWGDFGISGQRYLGYLDFGPEPWRAMFEIFADADRHPIVLHCTAGKDRTGVSTAFLLSVLGVSREIIEADYLLTNRDVHRQVDYLESTVGLPYDLSRDDMVKAAGVPETAMHDFLNGVEARWGSAVGYLEHIGITEPTFAAVREAFLD